MSSGPSDSPAPRKRVALACSQCSLKKIKCDGVTPICNQCQSKGSECTFVPRKRRLPTDEVIQRRPHPIDGPQRTTLPGFSSFSPRNYEGSDSSPREMFTPPAPVPIRHLQPASYRSILDIPPEESSRLLQIYFNCVHPLWPILYKPMYSSLDYSSPKSMIPPALVAAIYAFASCIELSQQKPPHRNIPTAQQFVEEAINLLQQGSGLINVFAPSITSCQVLTILSLQQHGIAEYARAGILCSLASAMAIELRIHRQENGRDDIEKEVRSRLWWNIYILEKLISSEMGRPIMLRSEECDIELPSCAESDEFELMVTQNGGTSIKLRTISGMHAAVDVSLMTERISREVYGLAARKAIRADQSAGHAKRLELWSAIQEWEHKMNKSPLGLDLSPALTSVPAAVTNHVVMWHATILLHRPFIARWTGADGANPLDICLEAANKICQALELYFDRLLGLPCDMIFSIFTAASTFLYRLKHGQGDDEETKRKLKLCIGWLSTLGRSWKSAGARHQILDDMYDLPPELRRSAPPSAALSAPSPNQTVSSMGPPRTPATVDWDFLRGYGNTADEFFELDAELRDLLGGQFELGGFDLRS